MPVVMLTGMRDLSVSLSVFRNGIYDYLLKPIEREQLLATVGRVLENRAAVDYRIALTRQTSNHWSRRAPSKSAARSCMLNVHRTLPSKRWGMPMIYKDKEAEGHSKRVTAFTIAIARQMGCPKESIDVIARGAFLHDIGKLAIPDSILHKPGALTPEEVVIMREHCFLGYRMLRNKVPFLKEVAENCLILTRNIGTAPGLSAKSSR